MIKKLLLLLAAALLATATMQAVPAFPFPQRLTQPDGSTVMVTMHGDEWFNYGTTTDGYTVVQDNAGRWVYAQVVNDALAPTSVQARDAQERSDADVQFLQSLGTNVLPSTSAINQAVRAKKAPMQKLSGRWDISKFRGLVILVQFNDRSFQQPGVFNEMLNKEGFTGYQDNVLNKWVECTGSVHDYFKDNSNGNFAPKFDVYGPVTVDYPQAYPQQASNAQPIFKAALKQLDSVIDYSKYDTNGDGVVDMVFFICPGGGSHAGNNSTYLWPHASTLTSTRYDGVTFGRYACSTELYGLERNKIIDGIGTICHEFSHVLGYADHYDVNYYTSGLSSHPGKWDLMAGANYLNYSRTPAGLSLYERWVMDWAEPQVISTKGTKRVLPLQSSNSGYRINSTVTNEYFLIENRKKVRWDSYLPGDGLLVWRVDSTNETAWTTNKINVDPDHNYLQIMRASEHDTTRVYNSRNYTVAIDGPWDVYPGTDGIDSLVNHDDSKLVRINSWTGLKTEWTLKNIARTDDYCTFRAVKDPINFYLEPFESMPLTHSDTTGVQGAFSKWTLTGGARICQPDSGWADGKQAAGLIKNSEIYYTDPVPYPITTVKFNYYNPSSNRAVLRCYSSTDGGATWQGVSTFSGSSYLMIDGGASTEGEFKVASSVPALIKFKLFSGSATTMNYIDNIRINYEGSTVVQDIEGDMNGDGLVNVTDVTTLVNHILGVTHLDLGTADLDGDGLINVTDVTVLINLILK